MSKIISTSTLSHEVRAKFKADVDSLLMPFDELFKTGWQLNLKHTISQNLAYNLAIREGKNCKINEDNLTKMRLLTREPQRIITGEDSLEYLKQLACQDMNQTGRVFPIHDRLINLQDLNNLTPNDLEWLHSHFCYTPHYGGLRLELHRGQQIIIGFSATNQSHDLYFAIQIAKLYGHTLNIRTKHLEDSLCSLKNFPIGKFWLSLSQN